ncbi:hypothetical protein [Longispora albida]|uniref:hypothetical protein n=1 Tax=Longispora albida TaxID=203523 RepID=UPI000372CCBF|nr:hypothetical protein [Longispora albida]
MWRTPALPPGAASEKIKSPMEAGYVNKCGFHIVEYFSKHHPDPHTVEASRHGGHPPIDDEEFFRFVKVMKE